MDLCRISLKTLPNIMKLAEFKGFYCQIGSSWILEEETWNTNFFFLGRKSNLYFLFILHFILPRINLVSKPKALVNNFSNIKGTFLSSKEPTNKLGK